MSIAVITQAYNEGFFLPIWLHHYGRLVGYENLFVIDDGSDDGSTDDPRIRNILRKEREPLNESEKASFISGYHAELLKRYDVAIFTDCDELIVVDPAAGVDFKTYIEAMIAVRSSCIRPIGFNVLHDVGREPAIDLDKSLFSQRHYLRFQKGYCKPLISSVPIQWTPGFHDCNLKTEVNKNLILFHLRSIDYQHSARRIRSLNTVEFSAHAIRANHSYHFRWEEDRYLKSLYDEQNAGIPTASRLELAEVFLRQVRGRDGGNPVVRVPARFTDAVQLSPSGGNP